MIRKILTLTLCLVISSCGGFTKVAGLKFKSSVDTGKPTGGNPNSLSDVVKLENGIVISFPRPIGECGARISFFGIILPVIPVWATWNSCEDSFDINISRSEILNVKLKYNGIIYDPVVVKKKIDVTHSGILYGLLTEYRFQIINFWKFRMADDKAIIVSGKTKDGKDFTEELPVKWGVMTYYNWAVP